MSIVLEVKKLNKIYPGNVHALKDVSFSVREGEFLVVIGLSGSGKSTLLRCINRLIDSSSGSILFKNKAITHIAGRELREYRSNIGMIFQHFNLIPRKSVLNNVLTGAFSRTGIFKSIIGNYGSDEYQKAKDIIDIVNMSGRENSRADKLSGGQQQRVAIARALMQNPKLLLADEPVASLDPSTSHSVMSYLQKVNKDLKVTVICNLHFLSLVRQYATRVIALKDGEMVYQGDPSDIDKEWFKKIYGEEAQEVTVE